MSIELRNDKEVEKFLSSKISRAVEYTLDEILKVYKKDIIMSVVYGAGAPSVYNRTGEFAEAWDKKVQSLNSSVLSKGEMFYDWESMNIGTVDEQDDNFGQHIGVADPYGGVDARQYLADIIYQGTAGNAFGHGYWQQKRNAFDRLIKYIGKQRFRKWFNEGCQQAGLDSSWSSSLMVEYDT